MNGTLAKERFVRYLNQDTIYIRNYSDEMSILAQMLSLEEGWGDAASLFLKFSQEGMEAEKSLHSLLFQKFECVFDAESSLTTRKYIAHTRQYIDSKDVELSMAAILPCILIYNRVGEYIANNSKLEDNPYRDWIETYSSDIMGDGVNLSVRLSDSLAERSSQARQAAMKRAFMRAVWFEWAFWEYGYNGVDVNLENI